MNTIKVLDCTLRDGGYINKWKFGNKNIRAIIDGLCDSGIDIIECGFLDQSTEYNPNTSNFNSIDSVAKIIPKDRKDAIFVCMINYGYYNVDSLPVYDGTSIDGIRIAFHKKEIKEIDSIITVCEKIRSKGYRVFMQPMVSLSYSDNEFLYLIQKANIIKPYSFYIVDTFGAMKKKDLIRLFYMLDHNLDKDIYIGYHSHNNLQLSYSNAQALIDFKTNRNLIIDSSVFGMGRGAGNLNTELFVQYLNENLNFNYKTKPLFQVIDEVLMNIYFSNYWGYSLPYCISATNNCHPNYASFLDEKKTLTIENINDIIKLIDEEHKLEFNREYIDNLYTKYLSLNSVNELNNDSFKELIKNHKVLIICPGKTSETEKNKIIEISNQPDVLTISVNFDYKYIKTNYIFVSNLKRYQKLTECLKSKMIVTSNINTADSVARVKYTDLLNDIDEVKDNAGLMVINFVIKLGVKEVLLAGIDGYSYSAYDNYANEDMTFITTRDRVDAMNQGIQKILNEYSQKTKLVFVTNPKYISH